MVIKRDLKVLRYISRHKHPTRAKLCARFGAALIDSQSPNYVRLCDSRSKSESGIRSGDIPPETEYYLTDAGIAEVESHQWFTCDYVIKHIIIPIAVGILSSVITSLISTGKLPFL